MRTQRAANRIKGMTLIEVLVVIAVIAVLAAMLLPALSAAKRGGGPNCFNNLKQIGLSYRIWAGDNGDKYPMEIYATNIFAMRLMDTGNSYLFWRSLSNEFSTPKILHCPADKQGTNALSFTQGFSDANISYFFNVDSAATDPQMILTGDDNLVVDGMGVPSGILNLSTNASVTWTKERHNSSGNIGLADGSVQSVTSNSFKSFILDTNRLVIP